jgi:hypothetical protein
LKHVGNILKKKGTSVSGDVHGNALEKFVGFNGVFRDFNFLGIQNFNSML